MDAHIPVYSVDLTSYDSVSSVIQWRLEALWLETSRPTSIPAVWTIHESSAVRDTHNSVTREDVVQQSEVVY